MNRKWLIYQVASLVATMPLSASLLPVSEMPFEQLWNPVGEPFEILSLKNRWPQINFPENKVPDLFGEKQFSFSLKLSSPILLSGEKPFFAFSYGAELPVVTFQPIELHPPALGKKMIAQSDSYPDFTPFGQWWLKDPLGNFGFFKEQIVTSSMIRPKEWSVEESVLNLFLLSSLSRMERELDTTLLNASLQITSKEEKPVINSSFRELPLLPSSFSLKKGVDCTETMKFADIPLLTSLINKETDRNMANACYEYILSTISLPTSFQTTFSQGPLVGQSLQILENRSTAFIFLTHSPERGLSSNSSILLEDLLESRKIEENSIDQKTLISFSPLLTSLNFPIFHNQFLSKIEPQGNRSFLSHFSFLPFNLEKARSLSLSVEEEKRIIFCEAEFPPILNVSYNPEAYQFLVLENDYSTSNPSFQFDREENRALRHHQTDLFFDYSMTLARIYTDFFFIPVNRYAKKGTVALISFDKSLATPSISSPSKQHFSSIFAVKNLVNIPLEGIVASDNFPIFDTTDSLTTLKIETIDSFLETANSPLYCIKLHYRKQFSDELAVASPLALLKESFPYFREPSKEISEQRFYYGKAIAFSPLIQQQKRPQPTLFNFDDRNHFTSIFITMNTNSTSSPEEIPFYVPAVPISRLELFIAKELPSSLKVSLNEVSGLYAPLGEKWHYQVEPFERDLFSEASLQYERGELANLAITESVQKEQYTTLIKRCGISGQESVEMIHNISSLDHSFESIFTCNALVLNEIVYEEFTREANFDQQGVLLSCPVVIDEPLCQGYYLLPLLDLTEIPFLALSGNEVGLIEIVPLSGTQATIEMAKRKNQANRFTQMDLAAMPSLEYLKTDSMENDFEVVIRTMPKKSGVGHDFSILLSPNQQASLDKITNHVYFLIDRSVTIEEHRFFTFLKGVVQAADYLDEGTPFNIVFFDTESEWFENEDLIAKKSTSAHLRKNLKGIPQRGKSNIQTFCKLVGELKTRAENSADAYTLILLSDGRFMKNIRIHRYPIREIVEEIPDNFSLYAVATSDNNNMAMLNTLTGLCHGDTVYTKTHSAFGRKLSALTKRVHNPLGYSVKVTQIDGTDSTKLYDTEIVSAQLYADKVFKIYGETKEKQEFTLLIQAFNGDRWLNIPKKITFDKAISSPSRLSHDIAQHEALSDIHQYLKTGDLEALNQAKDLLVSHNLPSPVR